MKAFTYQYHQPSEYRFSLDSIEMPLRVAEHLKSLPFCFHELNVLDLCAGCGVVGFELHFHLPEIASIDFVEVQQVYDSFFHDNLKLVTSKTRTSTKFRFLNKNYSELLSAEDSNKYELVVCNPPYFEKDQGKLSPSDFKNRCRFYLDSDFQTLVLSLLHVLKVKGMAFVLIRSLSEHKKDLLLKMRETVQSKANIELLEDIRGTHLVKITKII